MKSCKSHHTLLYYVAFLTFPLPRILFFRPRFFVSEQKIEDRNLFSIPSVLGFNSRFRSLVRALRSGIMNYSCQREVSASKSRNLAFSITSITFFKKQSRKSSDKRADGKLKFISDSTFDLTEMKN